MTRRAELESQVAVLREAKQRLEEHVASQDEQLARADVTDEALRSLQAKYDELAEAAGPAMLAVARRLEANAATMAIAEGLDIADYNRLIRRAHELRTAVGDGAERYEAAAGVLYEELAQPSPRDSLTKIGWSEQK